MHHDTLLSFRHLGSLNAAIIQYNKPDNNASRARTSMHARQKIGPLKRARPCRGYPYCLCEKLMGKYNTKRTERRVYEHQHKANGCYDRAGRDVLPCRNGNSPCCSARTDDEPRNRIDGGLGDTCRDLYEDEFTLVFKPPTGGSTTPESSVTGERWRISLDPQGHLGCTNLWTAARVTQAISKKLNLDYGFVSNAMSRADSRYIKLKITSDPDEVACARRNRRFWRLVIEKESAIENQ